MLERYKGDFRIFRVVMESKDPMATLHAIRNNEYSIITLLDMLEMLDVKQTIIEDETYQQKLKAAQNKTRR